MQVSLISGGAGFIGSHLADFLLDKGHKVIVIDNLACSNEENISHLLASPHFSFIQEDICQISKSFIESLGKIDYVFHLASFASPKYYMLFPIETLQVGSAGTQIMLEIAKRNDAVFILTSTSEVYGDPVVHPQSEDYWGNVNPIGIRSCYDESKRYSEAVTMAYHRTFNIKTRIARIFNTFGPRMNIDDGRVIPAFIKQALSNNPLEIFGTGDQTRSFTYVSDIVEGLWLLAQSNESTPVNLGNPDGELSILQIAKQILKLTDSQSSCTFCENSIRPDDPKMRRPNIEKAKSLLLWTPKISLQEGLILTLAYFKSKKLNEEE